MKSACCVNKMSEFAFDWGFVHHGNVISLAFRISHYISRYNEHWKDETRQALTG
ncbi:conserved hypothetical protein [Xenorhabdus bovienii str. Intermedium]|nr:conserved hypothetical protein [Xenorhabdus bovienii str. Intermedium]